MRVTIASRVAVLFVGVVLMAACQNREQAEKPAVEPVYFPASDVCGYAHGGPGKLFVNLGSGNWARSIPDEPASQFECVGSNPQVQFANSGGTVIQIDYSATGVEKGGSMLSLTYTATGTGPIPNESTYRNAFSNLADSVTRQSLGNPLPDLLKKKISNLSSYAKPGAGSAENYDVGKGFIQLTREATDGNTDVSVSVKIFPDTALKIDQ